ncbi:MAG: tRNA (cytidine(34)-2'-O)-methyltransferase [Pirellulaceae bacterium]
MSDPNEKAVSVPQEAPCLQVDSPPVHVVLYQPEIPQNTGNIGRTCVAIGAKLWLIKPLGFKIDAQSVRRAGVDYWHLLNLQVVDSMADVINALPDRQFWYFSRFAHRSLWDPEIDIRLGDVIVFGSESSGLPRDLLDVDSPFAIRIPTTKEVRSLNLSNTAAIAVYEVLRRAGRLA